MGKKELKEYKEACLSAKFYPFSLIFSDKQVEMVALDALQFKFLTEAFEELRKQKPANLAKLSKLLHN